MTIEHVLQNIQTLLNAVAPVLALTGAVGGGVVYGLGKMTDSPAWCRWGKNSWVGAGVLFAISAVTAIIQNLSQRIVGGG